MRLLRILPFAAFAAMVPIASGVAQTPVPTRGVYAQSVRNALNHPSAPLSRYRLDLNSLRRFYEGRDFQPVWSDDVAAQRRAGFALSALERADEDGLDTAVYHLDAIRSRRILSSPSGLAEFDLLLTAGVMSYMRDLRIGRVTPTGPGIELPIVTFDTVAALSDMLSRDAVHNLTAETAPPHQEYIHLKIALARYRKIDQAGGWPKIAAATKLEAGNPHLAALRIRLAAEDSLLGNIPAPDTIAELTEALKRYQARNGLEPVGTVGKLTLASLNLSVADRINQILVNMERWRWLPHPFEQTYIEANAAAAMLKVVDGGKIVMTSRIITGKPATPTPIFTAMISAITVNPYWNIPNSIARNEILPREKRQPGYMASQNIDFDGPNGTLRQQPGEKNALGRVKLEMPNRFNSYLHDTPSRSLFARNERHLSHGCMRVEKILPLASWALTGDADAALDKITAAIARGDNQKITLDRPVPVYVLYWTVIADRDGLVETRPDIYGRDKKLLAALSGQRLIGKTASSNANCQAVTAG